MSQDPHRDVSETWDVNPSEGWITKVHKRWTATIKTSAWIAAAANEVCPLAKTPRDPGGSVRRTPGLSTKKRIARQRWNIFTSNVYFRLIQVGLTYILTFSSLASTKRTISICLKTTRFFTALRTRLPCLSRRAIGYSIFWIPSSSRWHIEPLCRMNDEGPCEVDGYHEDERVDRGCRDRGLT